MKKTIRLTESDLIKIVKRVVRENRINEISPSTFRSAARQSSIDRGTPRRTNYLSNLFFKDFIGTNLLDGEIEEITVDYRGIDHAEEYLSILIKLKSGRESIVYDINNDEFVLNINDRLMDRKDAVKLAKIVAKVNPDTKYKETGKYFKMKEWR